MEATSTDVRKNKDGSYTVMGAYNDGDTNIYVVDSKGKRTGEVVGKTIEAFDFMLTNDKTHTQLLTNAIECFLSCFSICYKVSIVIKY